MMGKLEKIDEKLAKPRNGNWNFLILNDHNFQMNVLNAKTQALFCKEKSIFLWYVKIVQIVN